MGNHAALESEPPSLWVHLRMFGVEVTLDSVLHLSICSVQGAVSGPQPCMSKSACVPACMALGILDKPEYSCGPEYLLALRFPALPVPSRGY